MTPASPAEVMAPAPSPAPTSSPSSCTHCGLPVPTGLWDPDAQNQFCCSGCKTVYSVIAGLGLCRYYDLKKEENESAGPARPRGRTYAELDDPAFLAAHAQPVADSVRGIEFYLESVHCSACVWLVEKLPTITNGVLQARLDLRRSIVHIVWDERKVSLSRVAATLDSLGYPPHPSRDTSARDLRRREDRKLLIRIAVAGAGAGNVMLLAFALYGGVYHGMEAEWSSLFRYASLAISLVVLLWPGSIFFRGAIAALRTRTAHLDLPIAIGLLAGTVAGTVNTLRGQGEIYFDSLTGLVFLLLVGRFLQHRLERRAADAVELLFSLTPGFARLCDGDHVREIPIESLLVGQRVEVRPGESFPADGTLLASHTRADLSLLTGESLPVPLAPGDVVFAGAVNLDRPVQVEVTATGQATRVGQLLKLVENYAQKRAPIIQLADRMAGWFTLATLGLFVLTLLGWWFSDPNQAVNHAVSLLIVSCPCGLGLATPFAVSVALGRAARGSLLIKGGEVLERLGRGLGSGGTLFLDKTGTLTEGHLAVVAWHGETSVRPLVAALEAQSSHPIAAALAAIGDTAAHPTAFSAQLLRQEKRGIIGTAAGHTFAVGSESHIRSHASEPPGWALAKRRELTQAGLTPIWVARDGAVVAIVGLGNRLRQDAAPTIEKLRQKGIRLAILSGDDSDTVAAVGAQLGLPAEACRGGLLPEDKVRIIEAHTGDGPTFMVGDGVNDAAAFAAATVGIAVHGGAEASLLAADVCLTRPGLRSLLDLFTGAARTLRVIRWCIAISLGYNVVASFLAISGRIDPILAAVLMPMASFSVLAIALWSRTFLPPKRELP